jgi:hypothetical protein
LTDLLRYEPGQQADIATACLSTPDWKQLRETLLGMRRFQLCPPAWQRDTVTFGLWQFDCRRPDAVRHRTPDGAFAIAP